MCRTTETPPTFPFYDRLLARFYDPIMARMEERVLAPRRTQLLGNLQGRVLEVGAGTGANFSHYSMGADVLALEPVGPMLHRAEMRLRQCPPAARIQCWQAGIGDHFPVPQGGYDAIVFTLVLCTIPDVQSALLRAQQVLRPGGQALILEHIISDRPRKQFWQKAVNPCWKRMAGGCHLTRSTDFLLRQHGFQASEETYFTKGLRFYQAKGYFSKSEPTS